MVKNLALCLGTMTVLPGCSAETPLRTELMLVADTNIARVDMIVFEVQGPARAPQKAKAAAGPSAPGPRSLGLLYTGGKLGPFTLSATAFDGSEAVVSRKARVSFIKGQTLVVPLHLVASCEDFVCESPEDTCTERGCEPIELAAEKLKPWNGEAPRVPAQPGAGDGGWVMSDAGTGRLDGSAGDGGGLRDGALPDANVPDATRPVPDAGRTFCDAGLVDLMSDERHCGDCDTVCTEASADLHGDNRCVAGKCTLVCHDDWGDCDDQVAGCEQTLTVDEFCGSCKIRCNGAVRTCVNGQCVRG